jgi:hypothetical protein
MTDEIYENDLGGQISSGITLLPEGNYDYVIHGIVALGLKEQWKWDDKKNKTPAPPCGVIKIIFELPKNKKEDGESQMLSVSLPLKTGEKANFTKFVTTLMKLNDEDMKRLITSKGLVELLGKVGTLQYEHWENESKSGGAVVKGGFIPLHEAVARLEPVIATKPTFFFNPFKPDMEIWNNTLTFWTKKDIMSGLSVDKYPVELQQQWVTDQENESNTQKGTSKTPENAPLGSTTALE